MKVTPALKEELANWLDTYWTTYLKGDIKTWATFIRDDYRNIGGTKEEIWNSKQEIIDYTNSILNQMLGTVDIRNRKVELIPYGEYMMVHEFTDLFVKVEGEWIFYGPFRMSSLLEKTNTGWIALHQHGSYPDMKAMEGEAFSIDALKAENAKLQDAVKSRTIDLEHNNRELEIEAAVEKVRVQSMAMQHPGDLEKVNKELLLQLTKLKIPGLSGVSFYFVDQDEIVTVWDLSSPGNMNDPNSYSFRFDSKTNPALGEFVGILKSTQQDYFILDFPKDKLLQAIEELKNIDLNIYNTFKNAIESGALQHQWNPAARITDGILSIDLMMPPGEDTKTIVLKMAGAFNQAYQRFLDLQKAEAQARESQIQLALERVRAKSMAMHKSDELSGLSLELVKQVQALGVATWFCAFNINDEDPNSSLEWGSNGKGTFPQYRTPREGVFLHYYEASQRGETFLLNEIGENECPAHYEYLCSLPGVGDQLLQMKDAGIPFPSSQIDHVAFFKYGYLIFITYEPAPEAHDIFIRFAKVFEQTYTRFLDLQKAEAQAREAQIEAALERVRSRSMGMQKSEELKEVIKIVHQQLRHLNIHLDHAGFVVDYTPGGDWHFWIADEQDIPSKITHPYFDSVWANQFNEAKEKGADFFATLLNFEEKNKFYKELLSYVPGLPEVSRDFYLSCPGLAASTVLLENVALYIENFSGTPYTNDENNTLMRFGKVFQQTYTRFLDLQKAEAQAREAKIETALEKVRSRTMSMQHSRELSETSALLFQQIQTLGVPPWSCGFNIWEQGDAVFTSYMGKPEGVVLDGIKIPLTEEATFIHFQESRDRGDKLFIDVLEGETLQEHYRYFFTVPGVKEALEKRAQAGEQLPTLQINHLANFSYGNLMFITYEPCPDFHDIFIRFAKVFEQTYTRFLDLQKAEAQARESQIEAALERVRSRSMAMHKSDELLEAGEILFLEMQKLGIESLTAGYVLIDKEEKNGLNYTPHPGTKKIMPVPVIIPHNETIHMQQVVDNWKKENSFFIVEMDENETIKHQTFIAERSTNFPLTAAQLIAISPARLFLHNFYFKEGYILIVGGTKLSVEQTDIMLRFAKVFQQTYTRFLDLQKAEAQAREAKIEAALEKARARTMGMQSSNELPEVANVLFLEVQALGIPAWSCGYNILAEDKTSATCCMSSEGTLQTPFKLRLFGEASFAEMGDFFRSEQTMLVQELGGKALEEHYAYMKSFPDLKSTFDQIDELGLSLPTYQINHLCKFTQGFLLFITYEKVPDAHDIFKRFTKVFEQTYTRFLDLKKAESQARQAKIETALEKVRARALAMQEPEELTKVAEVLRHEMGLLGVEELETCSIFIHDETINRTECWYALKDSRSEEKKLVSDHFPLQLYDTWVGREMEKFYSSDAKQASVLMQGANRKEWINYCEEKSISLQGYYGENIPDRTYHLYKFSHGAIGAASAGDISAESWDLLQRAASVFSLAYSRFKDLTQARFDLQRLKEEKQKAETALSELQTTQKQLIQSEKMASLGELTAGIAHEIQNPLNFVNNFSEVSKEMLDEMKEAIEKGDTEEAKEIMQDVIQNLEKINHHGKRADAIVKGMLQHSRSGNGQKEPTDINALADEYLRLAYHGLRAKDKSFNATIKTDYDDSLKKVNVIPQDIGRVILNLITNAFYAVDEKKKAAFQLSEGRAEYTPQVTVSTKLLKPPLGGLGVLISVSDNGPGIPQKILDKIFQPFFTTKPTGQGTGLGLSMSYDIVKAHGGELKVETHEGEGLPTGQAGTEFTILLPV